MNVRKFVIKLFNVYFWISWLGILGEVGFELDVENLVEFKLIENRVFLKGEIW